MKLTKMLDIQKEGGWIIASVPTVDRDRDRIMPLGIDLNNFRKNPLMFFGHNYRDPWAVIGTAAEINLSADSFRVRPELREPVNESDPMHIISALWNQNILRAASIGFIPKKGKPNEFGGTDFEEIELLEISIVPLPANQDALRLAIKGLSDESQLVSDVIFHEVANEVLRPIDLHAKRGRVLSASNEKKIRDARNNLAEVLAQLDEEPEVEGTSPRGEGNDKGTDALLLGGAEDGATSAAADSPAPHDERELAELFDVLVQNLKEGLL